MTSLADTWTLWSQESFPETFRSSAEAVHVHPQPLQVPNGQDGKKKKKATSVFRRETGSDVLMPGKAFQSPGKPRKLEVVGFCQIGHSEPHGGHRQRRGGGGLRKACEALGLEKCSFTPPLQIVPHDILRCHNAQFENPWPRASIGPVSRWGWQQSLPPNP